MNRQQWVLLEQASWLLNELAGLAVLSSGVCQLGLPLRVYVAALGAEHPLSCWALQQSLPGITLAE